jgi:hypothetical protein
MATGRQLGQTHADLCAAEFRKRVSSRSSLRWGLNSNRCRAGPFEFDKRCQLFAGAHDESLFVGGFWSCGFSSRFDQVCGSVGRCNFSKCTEVSAFIGRPLFRSTETTERSSRKNERRLSPSYQIVCRPAIKSDSGAILRLLTHIATTESASLWTRMID